jgi:hypothetical protein
VAHVEFGPEVDHDVKRARRSGEAKRIANAIARLERDESGLDIVALQGRPPWRRLRTGDWRIIFRPLTSAELKSLPRKGRGLPQRAYLVARIVNKRDVERAIRRL